MRPSNGASGKRSPAGMQLLAGAVSFALLAACIRWFSLDLLWHDTLLRATAPVSDSDIVLITTDERTVERFSDPAFWSRARYESLLRDIAKQHPKAIVFDAYFSARTIPENVDWELLESASGSSKALVDTLFEHYETAIRKNDYRSSMDRDFADAIASLSGKVFLPTLERVSAERKILGTTIAPYEAFLQWATTGYANVIPDPDGSVRQFLDLFPKHRLSLAQAVVVSNGTSLATPASSSIPDWLIGTERYIRYSSNPYPRIPFENAYVGDFRTREGSPIDLRGKIALVGDYGEIFGDYFRVPTKIGFLPGVEVLANEVSTLKNASAVRSINPTVSVFTCVLAFLFAFFVSRALPGAWAALTVLPVIIAGAIASYWAFLVPRSVSLPFLDLALALFCGLFVPIFFRTWQSRHDKLRLRRFFSKFVGKNIVDLLMDQPDFRLDGEKREITVSFSDIKNFTDLSEKLDPEAVIRILDTVFERSNRIVFDHDGTLDKYIGDCIMAFWGAPLENPHHARDACRSALSLAESIHSLNGTIREEHGIELFFRTGIATGTVTVGSIGTEDFSDYTVIGDRVNLASRLEGINKVYGTGILLDENTCKAIEWFVVRELDTIRVKGKNEPITVYELLAEWTPSVGQLSLIHHHSEALAAYRAGDFSQAMELFRRNDAAGDQVAATFIDRIERLERAKTPPSEWAGIWRFTEK